MMNYKYGLMSCLLMSSLVSVACDDGDDNGNPTVSLVYATRTLRDEDGDFCHKLIFFKGGGSCGGLTADQKDELGVIRGAGGNGWTDAQKRDLDEFPRAVHEIIRAQASRSEDNTENNTEMQQQISERVQSLIERFAVSMNEPRNGNWGVMEYDGKSSFQLLARNANLPLDQQILDAYLASDTPTLEDALDSDGESLEGGRILGSQALKDYLVLGMPTLESDHAIASVARAATIDQFDENEAKLNEADLIEEKILLEDQRESLIDQIGTFNEIMRKILCAIDIEHIRNNRGDQ